MKKREPFEFMLWTAIIGMGMTFLVLSAFFMMRVDRDATLVLPSAFSISSLVIIASSITLHFANQSFSEESFTKYRTYFGATLLLGLAFVACQIWGWNALHKQGFFLKNGKVSGSFIYIMTGLHILHLAGGLLALLYIFVPSVLKRQYVDAYIYAVNPPNQLRLRMTSIYWHFVDLLWIYLYLFFTLFFS